MNQTPAWGYTSAAMKPLWCWRCKIEVPMLDEDEYKLVVSKHGTKGAGGKAEIRERFYGPVLREYERITGFRETNPNAVYHHRLSLYGPPCSRCQKPLRTPKAKFCAACGHLVDSRRESLRDGDRGGWRSQ